MNIDRFARWYRWVEFAAFGRALERRRFVFLDRLANARHVLIPGEGDGRTLARLIVLAPQAQIDVLELSGEMIKLARRRAGNLDHVHFRQENALTAFWPHEYYDGIVTLFFFDCFNEDEARGLIHRLVRAMTPGAVWLVGEFAIPERGWRRWHATIWIWTMYRFFAAVTGLRTRALPPIGRLLTEAGLRQLEWSEERWGLIRSEVWGKPDYDRIRNDKASAFCPMI